MEKIKDLGKPKASLIADYILCNYGLMSHLKLQKLIYYCEAYHLAYFETSLIEEEFEAWVHGPVSLAIYKYFKDTSILYGDIGFNGSYNPNEQLERELTTSQLELINDVLQELSKWSGLQLENLTHKETPWLEARNGYASGEICNVIISKHNMLNYYKKELNGQVS